VVIALLAGAITVVDTILTRPMLDLVPTTSRAQVKVGAGQPDANQYLSGAATGIAQEADPEPQAV